MKYLTIMRHAKSSWAEPDMKDFDRPLNERGRNAIPLVGKFLLQKKLHPDLVISSPAKRAKTTAAGIVEYVNYKPEKIVFEEVIYFGGTEDVYELVKETDDSYNDVFLFGHEPKLSGLIALLTGEDLPKFPTCSAYRISFPAKDWASILLRSGKCEFFVNPKLLGEK